MTPAEPAPECGPIAPHSGAGSAESAPGPRLPGLIVVTDRRLAAEAGHTLADVVAAAVGAGARAVLLREKDLPAAARSALADSLAALLAPHTGAHLLVAANSPPKPRAGSGFRGQVGQPPAGRRLGESHRGSPGAGEAPDSWPSAILGDGEYGLVTGVHLAAVVEAASPLDGGHGLAATAVGVAAAGTAAPGEGRPGVVGRSCHDLDELRRAAAEGVDYVTFSPVWVTASKPGYGPAVGLGGLERACATVPDLPVYALGGVTPSRVAACREAGAAGVAVMGAVMRAPDPAAVVCEIRAELGETGRA